MSDPTNQDDAIQAKLELVDEQLDDAVGGAGPRLVDIKDGTSNIRDGTSNIKDGLSNITDGSSNT